MFKNYLNCKYKIYNEFYQEKLNLKKREDSESDKLRFAKGIQFENDYFVSNNLNDLLAFFFLKHLLNN